MANFLALKTAIQNAIKQNGNEEITGDVLQQILLSIVNTMGDGAINTIEQNLSNETLARQSADNTLQSNINSEAGARQGADNTLQSNINTEALARGNADTQLQNAINSEETARGNADTLLQGNIEIERNARIEVDNTLDVKIDTEKNQRIAAVDSLNAAITAINDSVKNGYVYAGIAQPSSAPMMGKVFYVATKAGKYVNFSNIQVPAGINILKKVGSTWVSEFVFNSDALMAEIVSFEEQVRTLLEDYKPIIINGDVVNAPDEVDITAQPDGLLKFKDKVYDPLVFSGMGRKYLRKNIRPEVDSVDFDGFVEDVPTEDSLTGTPDSIWWDRINEVFVGKKDDVYYLAWTDDDSFVPASTELIYMYDGNPYRWNGTEFYVDEDVVPTLKNILTQAMLTQQNTIYVIQYDFTLGENITVPANCVLEFDGGSLSGAHTLTGASTGIKAELVKIFSTNITIAGTWNIAEAYPNWFEGYSTDIGAAINKAFLLSTKVVVPKGIYTTQTTIDFGYGILCGLGSPATFKNYQVYPSVVILSAINGPVITGSNIVVENIRLENTNYNNTESTGIVISGKCIIRNCLIANFIKYGISSSDNGLYYSLLEGCYVQMNDLTGGKLGKYGIYLRENQSSPRVLSANQNTILECVAMGGYEYGLYVGGNNNTIIGGDFSLSSNVVEGSKMIYLGGSSNKIDNPYLENPSGVCVTLTGYSNEANLFGPALEKSNVDMPVGYKAVIKNYHGRNTYDYRDAAEVNLFDAALKLDGNNYFNPRGLYIKPYYNGSGGVNAGTLSILDETLNGNPILRITFNDEQARGLSMERSDALASIIEEYAGAIHTSAYVRVSLNKTPSVFLNGSDNKRYDYSIGGWQLLTGKVTARGSILSFLGVGTGSDPADQKTGLIGTIDIAIPRMVIRVPDAKVTSMDPFKFDSSGKIVLWNGTAWVDATGTPV